jgi:hypothetical protein
MKAKLKSTSAGKAKPTAHEITEKAIDAISHLQLQIDMIQEVLVDSGHLKVETMVASPPQLSAQQEPVYENPYFTPLKMKSMATTDLHEAKDDVLSSSPTLADLGLSSLGMSLMGTTKLTPLDSPVAPKLAYTQRDSVDTVASLDLTFDKSLDLNFDKQRESVDTVKSLDITFDRQRESVDTVKSLDITFDRQRESVDTVKSLDLKFDKQRESVDTVKSLDLKFDRQRESVDTVKSIDLVPPTLKRISDPNSLFNSLIAQISQQEYDELPSYLTAQLTRSFINSVVSGTSL